MASNASWILPWDPKLSAWPGWEVCVHITRAGGRQEAVFPCGDAEMSVGDAVYVTLFGTQRDSLIACGIVLAKPFSAKPPGSLTEQTCVRVSMTGAVDPGNEALPELLTTNLAFKWPEIGNTGSGQPLQLSDSTATELEKAWLKALAGTVVLEEFVCCYRP